MKIDISQEDEARRLESKLVRAHTMANLDAYAHPNEDESPPVKGVQFHIILKPGAQPTTARNHRYNVLAAASLEARVQKMIRLGMMQPSRSAWSSPVRMVPQEEKLAAWMNKHGERAILELSNPMYQEEVVNLYRLTGDFRQLNEMT